MARQGVHTATAPCSSSTGCSPHTTSSFHSAWGRHCHTLVLGNPLLAPGTWQLYQPSPWRMKLNHAPNVFSGGEWDSCGEERCTSHNSPRWPRCWPNRCHLKGDHRGDAQNISETQVVPYMTEPECLYPLWLFTGCRAASAVLEHIPLAAVIHCRKSVRTDRSNCVFFLCAAPSVMAHCYLILLGEIYTSSTAQMKDWDFYF